jgi:hypothetical protein
MHKHVWHVKWSEIYASQTQKRAFSPKMTLGGREGQGLPNTNTCIHPTTLLQGSLAGHIGRRIVGISTSAKLKTKNLYCDRPQLVSRVESVESSQSNQSPKDIQKSATRKSEFSSRFLFLSKNDILSLLRRPDLQTSFFACLPLAMLCERGPKR